MAVIRRAPRAARQVVYYRAMPGQFTRYWTRDEGDLVWREIGWQDIPKPAYKALRERVREVEQEDRHR